MDHKAAAIDLILKTHRNKNLETEGAIQALSAIVRFDQMHEMLIDYSKRVPDSQKQQAKLKDLLQQIKDDKSRSPDAIAEQRRK